MSYPTISIAIATLNASKTLEKTLKSIRKQNYPQNKIEILILDGGSKDNTITIAKQYRSKIILNKKVDIIYARHLGFTKAKGKYLIYLDADEILENKKSITLKYLMFKKNNEVRGVMPSGYKTPKNYSPINYYINEFGDPFSFFVYKESKGEEYLITDWRKKYTVIQDEKEGIILDLSKVKSLPLIELSAGGCMVDLSYLRKTFPRITGNPSDVGHLFYFFNKTGGLLALTKNDATIHYSSATITKYLKKIKSRIKNNIFQNDMGIGGFKGRDTFQEPLIRIKKYLFVPYTLSFFFPVMDGFILTWTRKKIIYILHPLLCLYTTFFILFYMCIKFAGINIESKSYGN